MEFGPEKWHPVTVRELAGVALDGLKWLVTQLHHEGLSDHHRTPPEPWPETMTYSSPLERIHDLVDERGTD